MSQSVSTAFPGDGSKPKKLRRHETSRPCPVTYGCVISREHPKCRFRDTKQ